ncbi:MAG: ABC transporter ATP-binding protein [Deltaproteobacteria bacterium]|nr:ABC transporter ATP-binding protein [Deltaproteobacteria bacterium]
MTHAIEIFGIKKSYGPVEALKGIDLSIRQGEFFGLLGPNGAGKTTLINSLFGLVNPSQGSIQILGINFSQNPSAAKQAMGLCPQELSMNNFTPIEKLMQYQGGFYGLSIKAARSRAEELLKQFGLWEKRKGGRFQLSGGMQRRLMIARALMGKPKILVLDEPTAGIDVELRHELWVFLKELNASGTTLLLTTHYIEEAERLCDRVAIIHKGNIVACDTPAELIARHQSGPDQERTGMLKFIRPGSLEEVFVNITGRRIEGNPT